LKKILLNFNNIIVVEPTSKIMASISGGGNVNTKRRKIPAWLRDELGRIEKEKEKKIQNTSNNNLSINDSSSVSIIIYNENVLVYFNEIYLY